MTNTTATPVRVLLDDAISEYISDTGDAPHYREHLLDLLEATLQADQQDTVTISREDAEFIVAKLWVTDRSLFARSGEIQDRIKAQLTQEEPA